LLPRAVAGTAAVAAILLLALHPFGMPPEAGRAAAVSLAAVGLWASGLVPGHITALLFFLLGMLLAVAPASVVFSGFHSAALWLVFGGLILGAGIRETGLGERLARSIAGRFDGAYWRVAAGMVAMGLALAFLMPSTMGRVVLLLPVVLSLADVLGYEAGSRGRTGMVIAVAMGTFIPAFSILPANVPNVVLAGALESLYGVPPVYGSYLLLHFPVVGVMKAVAIVLVVWLLFRDRPTKQAVMPSAGSMSWSERRLAVILAVAVGLWVTDFLHHISPAWISLGAGLFCLLPRIGVLSVAAFDSKVNYPSMLYVAGIVSLGAVVAESGLGDILAEGLLSATAVAPGETVHNFIALTAANAVIGLATTLPGIPAVMTPLAENIATATGLPLMTVVMIEVLGYSSVILPYQAPPLVVAVQLGGVTMADMTRAVLALLLVTVFLLLPLDFLWWRAMGYLP